MSRWTNTLCQGMANAVQKNSRINGWDNEINANRLKPTMFFSVLNIQLPTAINSMLLSGKYYHIFIHQGILGYLIQTDYVWDIIAVIIFIWAVSITQYGIDFELMNTWLIIIHVDYIYH